MKVSFSTLGCPSWSWKEIYAAAKDFGFDGIEVRGVQNQIYAPKVPEFADPGKAAGELRAMGLEIPLFTSGAVVSDQRNIAQVMAEAMDYIVLAERAGVPYVRVLTDRASGRRIAVDLEFAAGHMKLLCEFAALHGVTVLTETNGVLGNSKNMLEFLDRVASDRLAVLWDVHHTVRYFNESPADTVKALGKRIRHVHLKDSRSVDGRVEYQMTGYGDIPLQEAIDALKAAGYEGWLSLEWVKRWSEQLAEPGIVFPHFLSAVRAML